MPFVIEAGRVSGSSRNSQPWRFIVVESPSLRERLAEAVYASANVRGAALVVVIAVRGRGPTAFDAGRAAQNMMLTAWNDHIGACPNGMPDPDAVGDAVRVDRIALLEQVRDVAAAAQLGQIVRFARSQTAEQVAVGVHPRRTGALTGGEVVRVLRHAVGHVLQRGPRVRDRPPGHRYLAPEEPWRAEPEAIHV